MQNVYDEVLTLDKRCYEEFLLSEDILMEHAANHLAQTIRSLAGSKNKKLFFLCGPGNNGGDGIACARILHKEYDVSIYLPYGAKSKMARLQKKRYELVGGVIAEDIDDSDIYIDALFGSGLSKKLDKRACEIIRFINEKKRIKVSCDIPSGIGENFISDEVFRADVSVSMGALKLPLFEDFAKDFVGKIEVANLGVAREIYENSSDIYLLDVGDMKLPYRTKSNTNKGTFGHTCVVQGSKEGAAILSATAALNFGSGLVTVINDKKSDIPPYIMHSDKIAKNCTSLVVGMGFGESNFDLKLLFRDEYSLVIDADIFYNPVVSKLLKERKNIVLTPHPKEFASLLKITKIAEVDAKEIQSNRFKFVKLFAQKFPKATLILKGANTIITQNEKIYISTLGTSILSKGGSGDVLSGMIGSLLAQGYETKDAAITAVLAHALAAKNVAYNDYALNPIDICEEIKCL